MFAASSVVFLLPYLLMFPAAFALRIPHRLADWRYTGPLLGIVVGALVAGEALIWRGVHPRNTPRTKPRPLGPAAAS